MKKNWRKNILRGLCLTSVAFVFQACYGTERDIGYDTLIEGQVVSKTTGKPIKGIKVSTGDNRIQYDLTNEEGQFSFYTIPRSEIELKFEDVDSIQNGLYVSTDTLIALKKSEPTFVKIELEEAIYEEKN